MSSSYTWDELRGAELYWLLTLVLRGQRYRFSTVDLAVPQGSETLHYVAGLSPLDVLDAVPLPGGGVSDRSADIELLFSRDTADGWAALAAGAVDMGDGSAELALWKSGTDYDRRQVVLSGMMESLQYGARDEPVGFSLVESPWEPAGAVIPEDSAQVSSDTWPLSANSGTHAIGDGIEEAWYPTVIGHPGTGPLGTSYQATPALIVEMPTGGDNTTGSATVLVAGHATRAATEGASLTLHNLTAGTTVSIGCSLIQDNLGRTVSAIQTGSPPLIADGAELWVSWPNDGGLPSLREPATMRGAGEVLTWLLSQTGLRIDMDSLRALEPLLAGVKIDTHINEQTDPWDIVQDQLLPLLPVTWWVGPRGLTARRWPYDATPADAVGHIDAQRDCQRVSSVSRSSAGQVVNRLGIAYAVNASTDSHIGRLVYAPSKVPGEEEVQVNPYAMVSERLHGERQSEDVTTDLIADTASARSVLDWRLAWESSTRESVTFDCPLPFMALNPADVVTVTDSDLGWSERVAIVTSVLRTPGPSTELSVVTAPNFVRDAPI